MDEFVGIPYVAHGRSYEGADCWGIVYLFYRDVLKTPIPDYAKAMQGRRFKCRDIGPLIKSERAKDWSEVETPDFGNCVVIRNGRFETHVGIFIGNGLILHSETDCSRVERMNSINLRDRIAGYYELKT